MPSTYTAGLGLEKIANGEQAGSWGTTTNENLDFLEKGINGNASVTLSSTTYTLDIQDGAACTARNQALTFSGSPGGNVAVSLTPNTYPRVFYAKNSTAYTLTFSQGSGASLALLAGASAVVVADGAGAGAAVVGVNISPLTELMTFKTSSAPAMDGVGRIFRDTGGMRYDGLTHRFDVGSGAGRVTALSAFANGRVSLGSASDLGEALGVAGNETLQSASTSGTQVLVKNTDTGGKEWQLVSAGSANVTGAGYFFIRNSTDDVYAMKVSATGVVTFVGNVFTDGTLNLNNNKALTAKTAGGVVESIAYKDTSDATVINTTAANIILFNVGGVEKARLTATGIIQCRRATFSDMGVFADNAGALAGGYVAGDIYKTGTGDLRIVY